jgi:hypothetical protein
LKVY